MFKPGLYDIAGLSIRGNILNKKTLLVIKLRTWRAIMISVIPC